MVENIVAVYNAILRRGVKYVTRQILEHDKIRVDVATIALGLGVDLHRHISWIILWHNPRRPNAACANMKQRGDETAPRATSMYISVD